MRFTKNYWVYSTAVAIVWVILLVVAFNLRGVSAVPILYVFGGYVIAWVSGTIARYVYPPPARWRTPDAHRLSEP